MNGIGNRVKISFIVGSIESIGFRVGDAVVFVLGFSVGLPVEIVVGDRLTGVSVNSCTGRFEVGNSIVGV